MSLIKATANCDLDLLLDCLRREFPNYGGISVTEESRCDMTDGNARCCVTVFERYSYTGGNRVSLAVTLFTGGDKVRISAVTSGGSQAVFFKLNIFGEEAFMDKFREFLQYAVKKCKTEVFLSADGSDPPPFDTDAAD